MYQYCNSCKTETCHFMKGGMVVCRDCGRQTRFNVREVIKSEDTNPKEVRGKLRNSDVRDAKTDRQGASGTLRDSLGTTQKSPKRLGLQPSGKS